MQDQSTLHFEAPATDGVGAARPALACARLYRSISEPLRVDPDYTTRMEGPDKGLINAWEAGRMKARDDPAAAARACAGELVVLPWKGGVEKASKAQKTGSMLYLAMWQGLRGEDLCIDMDAEPVLTCSATGTRVLYTLDASKVAAAA